MEKNFCVVYVHFSLTRNKEYTMFIIVVDPKFHMFPRDGISNQFVYRTMTV